MPPLVLPVPPSANRLWRRSGSTIHRSDAYRTWRDRALWALREQAAPWTPIASDAAVAIVLVGRSRLDVDNTIKPTLDLLESAGILANDQLVIDLTVRRRRSPEPARLEVTVAPLLGTPHP